MTSKEMKSYKIELEEINTRLWTYINAVKHFRSESDVAELNENISNLTNELKMMKHKYESEISSLQTSLDINLSQKIELDKEIVQRKNAEVDLLDQVKIHKSQLSTTNYEVSCLKTDLSRKDQEIQTLLLRLQQMKLANSESESNLALLRQDYQSISEKLLSTENEVNQSQNQLKSLQEKFDFQKRITDQKVAELKIKMDHYIKKMIDLDLQITEAQRKEAQIPDIFNRIRQNAKDEYLRLKSEIESFFTSAMDNLQNQLNTHIGENTKLKSESQKIKAENLNLKKIETNSAAKITSLSQQLELLEQTLASEIQNSNNTIQKLNGNLQKLHQNLNNLTYEAKHNQTNDTLALKAEIYNIKALLEDEEKRLQIEFSSTMTDKSKNAQITNSEDISKFSNNEPQTTLFNNPLHKHENLDNVRRPVKIIKSNEIDIKSDKTISKLPNDELKNPSPVPDENLNIATKENSSIDGSIVSGKHSNENNWVNLASPDIENHELQNEKMRKINLHTPDEIKISTSRSFISSREKPEKIEKNEIGKRTDYFEEMFKTPRDSLSIHHDQLKMNERSDYEQECDSLNSIKIHEVSADGKFVRILNSHTNQDFEIGNFLIKQQRKGYPVVIFRFPSRLKIEAGNYVTVWSAACNDELVHSPPSDFYFSDLKSWGITPEFTTLFCSPDGQAIAWTTPNHRVNPDAFHSVSSTPSQAQSDTSHTTRSQRTSNYNSISPEKEIGKAHFDSKMLPDIKSARLDQSFDNQFPSSNGNGDKYMPVRSARIQQISKHGDELLMPKKCKSFTLSTETVPKWTQDNRRMKYYPAIIQTSYCINNKTPEVTYRSLCEPPSPFQKPSDRYKTGISQMAKLQNRQYQPPMFKIPQI